MIQWISFFLLHALLVQAQGPLLPETPPAVPAAPTTAVPSGSAATEQFADIQINTQNAEGYNYDPSGRRDPFSPFKAEVQTIKTAPDVLANLQPNLEQVTQEATEPLQAFDLSQLKIVGIMWAVKNPKAMVKDPGGKLHLIKKNSKIGKYSGFVTAIREGEVEVVEPTMDGNVRSAVTRLMPLMK